MKELIDLIATDIASALFTMGGTGEIATRLELKKGNPERALGGWCQSAVEDLIRRRINGAADLVAVAIAEAAKGPR